MVSINCIAYNQERYISDAIEGFLRQQTDFEYEILIHDDASTDRTAGIIEDYTRQYPGDREELIISRDKVEISAGSLSQLANEGRKYLTLSKIPA